MAKKKQQPKKTTSKRSFAKAQVSKVMEQVKEPFSLLGTLKEEGMANVIMLLGLAGSMASGAKKNLRLDAVKPQLRELISSLGFAMKEDFDELAARVDELEHKLAKKEFAALSKRDRDEEE
ncbi:MAG: hypothetical protein ACXWQO_06695 [Bdellovibrionota bacterium]